MALVNTTLASAASAGATSISVTSATGFAVGQVIRVDNEYMVQSAAASGTVIPVRRGLEGTAQVAHGILGDVATGLSSDFPAAPAGAVVPLPSAGGQGRATIGADVTLATADLPVGNTTYVITKASACAITLEAPSKAANGLQLTFRSASAFAHTVTYTAGFLGGTTASDIATFAASVGASMTIEANGGTWGEIALASVTVA
jgi:hypothetical protein